MRNKLNSCFVLLGFLALGLIVTRGVAVGADVYNNFHVAHPAQITYTTSDGGESCKEYKGFGYTYNMYDAIVKCRSEAQDCDISAFTVAKSVNDPSYRAYKVFIPPGAISINIRILKPNYELAGAVVRYGLPITGFYSTYNDLGEKENFTLENAKSADRFTIGIVGRGQIYILKQSPVTEEEVGPDGGWLYFIIFASIQQISVSNNVNYQTYMDWVESWFIENPECDSIPCDSEICEIVESIDVCPAVTIASGTYIVESALTIRSRPDFPLQFSSEFGETDGGVSDECPD